MVCFSDLILGPQDNGFIQERGVVAGTRVGVVIVIPVFLAALVAVFLVVLVLFSGAILVAVLCLDKGWILAWLFGFLFCCCFGWRSRCSLGCCFGLCFCVVGAGTRIGSCMVVSVPLTYDFGRCFRHLMKHIDDCQTILTFQHVISSLRVYASAILNKVRGRYVKDPDCLAA